MLPITAGSSFIDSSGLYGSKSSLSVKLFSGEQKTRSGMGRYGSGLQWSILVLIRQGNRSEELVVWQVAP
jgi:hypothetical protein